MEALIAEEEVVVTITRTGYAKRTKSDLYRSQRRGGKGVMGAALQQDELGEHFFVGSTHDWILFFTNKGRVYRAKAYELPEANRTARGAHVANILAFQPDEKIAQVMQIKDYGVAPYLVLATSNGQVKKTRLTDFDSPRSGGVIAINLRDTDELVGAALIDPEQDLLLVTRAAMSIRFKADDATLRPMGRATEGVRGISLAPGDRLLSMMVVEEGVDVLVATERGFAKRTGIENYPPQGRGGKGVLTADPKARHGNPARAAAAGAAHARRAPGRRGRPPPGPEGAQGRPGRRAGGGARRRAVRHHLRRRRHPDPGQRRPAQQGPRHHGCRAHEA